MAEDLDDLAARARGQVGGRVVADVGAGCFELGAAGFETIAAHSEDAI